MVTQTLNAYISRKGDELDVMLLLRTNRKLHIRRPKAPSDLAVRDLECSKSIRTSQSQLEVS